MDETIQRYCNITIECEFDRYLLDNNTTSKSITKSVNVKYLQLIEDVIYRLELMDKVNEAVCYKLEEK